MSNPDKSRQSANFSVAFQQMANFVAIARTRNAAETLDGLVQQCYLILARDLLSSEADIASAVQTLFGIRLADRDISASLNRLKSKGILVRLAGGQLGLSEQSRQQLDAQTNTARALENDVKSDWLGEIRESFPSPVGERLWRALKAYLGQAFRRHGILAAGLLEPDARVSQEDVSSLSAILDRVVSGAFETADRKTAREAIGSFILTVRGNRKRAEYVTQLADGAFNYFSLAVAPEVSERLRPSLKATTVFLDTNFLLGILGLHSNPQVDVSKELVESVNQHKLPFRLRYHEATSRELSQTLHYFGSELAKRKWPQQISRAAVQAGVLSSIELRYHKKNAVKPLDVDDFLAPYRQWEILLRDVGIDIYRVEPSDERLRRRANLEAEYNEFLKRMAIEKPYEAVQHDMALLEAVHSLRSDSKNLLESGVLLVTCDHYLCVFDRRISRAQGRPASAVFPSLLWQILRPITSENEEFDEAFAETFALPEFVFARGGAQKAAAKMLSILSAYSDIPEETAFKLLTNDALQAELQTKKTDAEFAQVVDFAIAKENASLLEEKAGLERALEAERLERKRHEKLAIEKDHALGEKDRALQQMAEGGKSTLLRDAEALDLAKREHLAREEAEDKVREAERLRIEAEQASLRTAKIASLLVGTLVALLFEALVNYVVPWPWLLNHAQGYGLQASFSLILIFAVVGIGVKQWRKGVLVGGIFTIVVLVFSLLGGRTK